MIGQSRSIFYVPNFQLAHIKTIIIGVLLVAPIMVQAAPNSMGEFKIVSSSTSTGNASGTYTTTNGAKGSFTLIRVENRGYTNNVTFTPSSGTGNNGLEVRNNQDISEGQDRDKFTYTFTITPEDYTSIHTIKIGQASYSTSGNSEIARHTLSFIKDNNIDLPVQAMIRNNPRVNYFYNAMGDYFMGSKIDDKQLSSQNPSVDILAGSQLRTDSSGNIDNQLYYYNIANLQLRNNTNANPYTPILNSRNEVTLNSNNGVLPSSPTFERIFKSTAQNSSYSELPVNTSISNRGTYVSYGIENSASNYVVAIKNAASVTLTYEGIMNGNVGIARPVIGETFSEWISFGVESERNYVFSGNVFNDNGNIAATGSSSTDISNTFIGNSNYFNGIFDSNEIGISHPSLRVSLTDCKGNTITTAASSPNPQTVSSNTGALGQYKFIVLPKSLEGKTSLCINEIEPNSWEYSVDTTPNVRPILFAADTYNYANLDFGEVTPLYSSLVLKKYQYIHDCNENLNYSAASINDNNISQPTSGFSTSAASNIAPGKCIAYKIEAYNRGHVDLENIQISDTLQNAMVTSVFHLPRPLGTPTTLFKNSNNTAVMGRNGTILSDIFSLAKTPATSSIPTKATLYFNSRYGVAQ